MPRVHRRFSAEFKQQVIESILNGAVVSAVARAKELHPELVRKWVRDFRQGQLTAFAGRASERAENAKIVKLERELGQIAAENFAQKSAAARQGVSARERRIALTALARDVLYLELVPGDKTSIAPLPLEMMD